MYPKITIHVKFLMVRYPTTGVIASQLLGGFVRESNFNWNAAGIANGYNVDGIQREDLNANNTFSKNDHIVRKILYRRKQRNIKSKCF